MTTPQISLKDLANKSLAFAEKAGSPWKETGGSDCQAYQSSFLCRQSFGAYHTAKSYWILHENRCFSDCIALGRNLLERIANSICGSKSPTLAVELIASELNEKIRHAEIWNPSPGISAELQQVIAEHKALLPTFLDLIKQTKAPEWKFYRRFQVTGIESLYRSGYSDFSRYSHAGYETARPAANNDGPKAADFIALVAPVITAANYHVLDCQDCSKKVCDLQQESMSLLNHFRLKPLDANGASN